MKFTSSLVPIVAALVASVSVSARPILVRRDVDAALIPEFGFQSNVNPTGTGDCDGAVNGADGKPIKVPCACPPERNAFIQSLNANVAAGHAVNNPTVQVSFPTDSSKASQLARMQTALVTLQNLNGPGKGCPAASTTFLAQQKAIQDFNAPAAAPAPAPAAPANNAATAGGVDPALVPEFGFQSNVNPTGTGDCDGAVNGADGKPIKVPCACPPERNAFIQSLNANVAAGHAVNNPTVLVSFPTDTSKASQLARMQAALVTLQNLNGAGKGCPAASTTFLAQQKAIQDFNAPAAAPAVAPAAAAAPAAAPATNNAAASVDPALVPDLGFSAGVNPTGTGDCDGAVNGADGKPIKVPCACPPERNTFIQALSANVAAGKAVNNPTVAVSFPTDGSNASKAARIQASLVTLQNLNGAGKGCPAASTTLLAQLKAVQ